MAAFAGVAGAALAAEAAGAAPVDYGWYLDFYGGTLGAEGSAWLGEGWDAEETSAWRRACCQAAPASASRTARASPSWASEATSWTRQVPSHVQLPLRPPLLENPTLW